MDLITLAMAKAYSDSKGGYERKAEVLKAGTCVAGEPLGFGKPTVLEDGKTYLVRLNGTEYNCTATTLGEIGIVHLGNAALIDPENGADNGLPFIYFEWFVDGNWSIGVVSTESGDFSLEIPGGVVPIDPKFIPGAVLPVVELSTAHGDQENPATLTADESAQVQDALMTGLPAIISLVLDGVGCAVIANAMGGFSYMFAVAGNNFAIYPNEDGGFNFGIAG